jgi:hypothetical protein
MEVRPQTFKQEAKRNCHPRLFHRVTTTVCGVSVSGSSCQRTESEKRQTSVSTATFSSARDFSRDKERGKRDLLAF